MEKSKIIKKGIGIKGFRGVVDGRVFERGGCLFYITDSHTQFAHDTYGKLHRLTVVQAVWINEITGTPLSIILNIYDDTITWSGEIVDGEGREKKVIKITKYI